MNFFCKTKGVISVFLIIVMLPLFTSAVLLVDGARYQSAKTMIQEAGDLAAYSTISNYNSDLKERYGLFALSDGNVQSTFEKYFKETLGYSESAEESYSQKVQNLMTGLIGGNEYKNADFFNMYNFNVQNAKAEAIYDLAKPDVLQSQIVEFMKYRGVETVLERFEILVNSSKAKEESRKNEQLVNGMEELSGVDSRYSGLMSMITALESKVDTYNSSLNDVTSGYASFEGLVIEEMVDMAFFSESIDNTKYSRNNSCNTLLSRTNRAYTAYTALSSSVDTIIEQATRARNDYIALREKYKDHPELCEDIDKELETLNTILDENSNSGKSIVYLKSRLRYPSEEMTLLYGESLDLNSRLDDAHRKYNRDVREKREEMEAEDYLDSEIEEELKKIKYFLDITGNGLNWRYTDYIPVFDTETESEVRAAARNTVANLDIKRYTNFSPYKAPSPTNCYEDRQINADQTDGVDYKELAKNTADEANSKNTEKTASEEVNVKLSDEVFNKLPSQKANKGETTTKNVDGISENNASSNIKSANSCFDEIMSGLESGRDEVLTFCYIFDMFKTRVTSKNIGVVEGADKVGYKDTSHNKWYHTRWRYNDPRGEVDTRDRVKNTELDTVFNSKEIEYIFTGSKDEGTNGAVVYSWIYATRLANNLAAVYLDDNAKAQCEALAAACSAASMGMVPPAVFKWVFIAAWAAGETALELAYLIDDGYRVPLVKTKKLYIRNFWDVGTAIGSRDTLIRDDLDSFLDVCYEDYLIILLCFVGSDTRLLRIADLIQLNMNGGDGSGSFEMDKANTYVKCDTEVSIKYMFQPIKQFSGEYTGSGLKIKNQIYQGY